MPIRFWTDTKKPVNLGTLTPQERLELREILLTMEAKEWIERYVRRVKDHGKTNALGWWSLTWYEIEKKRGLKVVNELRNKMNELQRTKNVKAKT
jgi:hypothetical protein